MSSPDSRDLRIRGGQHHRYREAIEKDWLKIGCELSLVRDPENQYDPRAIKAGIMVPVPDGESGAMMPEFVAVGYVAADQAKHLYWRLDRGAVVMRCTVTKLEKNAIVAHLELQGGWKKKEDPRAVDEAAAEKRLDLEDDIPF